MIITITVEDFERDIYFKATGFDFDSAETELGRLERNYRRNIKEIDKEKKESVGGLLEELFEDFSNEYPLGGVAEPYDIETEKDLTN